jgi:hypothetical protein
LNQNNAKHAEFIGMIEKASCKLCHHTLLMAIFLILSGILSTSSTYLHNSILIDVYGDGLTQSNMDKNNSISVPKHISKK